MRLAPGVVMAWRLPSIDAPHGATVDAEQLYALLVQCAAFAPRGVVIERVGGMPRDGASRAWAFGFTCGLIHEAVRRAGIPAHYAAPQSWRGCLGVYAHARKYHISDTKQASRAVASELFPTSARLWPNAARSDLAEAALLAEYGARKLSPA